MDARPKSARRAWPFMSIKTFAFEFIWFVMKRREKPIKGNQTTYTLQVAMYYIVRVEVVNALRHAPQL